MTLRSKKGLISIVVLIVVIGITGAVYFATQSNRNSSNSSANNQEISAEQMDKKPEVNNPSAKKEETSKGITITTGGSQFGTMLFDKRGQAIYIWELEKSKQAECYGDCAKAWPPVLTDGAPIASGSVNSELLGTTKRTDGTTQVTYNGHPLYYYAHEEAGEVKCHNISTHGGLWWVIQPSGVRAPPGPLV